MHPGCGTLGSSTCVYAPSVPTAASDAVTHASATASARPIVTTARRGRTSERVLLRVVVIVLAFPVSHGDDDAGARERSIATLFRWHPSRRRAR